MKRDLRRLADETFDAAILGGGLFGLSAAWACSLRGMRVAVVEQGDFGEYVFPGSLNLLQGGMQDLSPLNLRAQRILALERRHLLHMAPHLVRPIPIVVPCYEQMARTEPRILCAALQLVNLATLDRNRGLTDPSLRIPPIRRLGRTEGVVSAPEFHFRYLKGAVRYSEAQVYSPERLCLAFAASASEQGVALANYAKVVNFEHTGRLLSSATVEDRLSGSRLPLRARFFLNMTRDGTDPLPAGIAATPGRLPTRWVKELQLVIRRSQQEFAFSVPFGLPCNRSWLQHGHGGYFSLPWHGHALIGPACSPDDKPHQPLRFTESEVARFLNLFNESYRGPAVKRSDVLFWMGSRRPIDADSMTPARETIFVDHACDGGPDNLLTVIGVKATTCCTVANRAADAVSTRLDGAFPSSGAAHPCLRGGRIDHFEHYVADISRRFRVGAEVALRLSRLYGSELDSVMQLTREQPDLALFVAGSERVLRAEVVYAAREECAASLTDVVMRRLALGASGHPGRATLEHCAALLAGEFGWSMSKRMEEVENTENEFRLSG